MMPERSYVMGFKTRALAVPGKGREGVVLVEIADQVIRARGIFEGRDKPFKKRNPDEFKLELIGSERNKENTHFNVINFFIS